MGQSKPFRATALIVEDDPKQRDMICLLLEESEVSRGLVGKYVDTYAWPDGRFEVRVVGNGFDAGMMVKEYRPDIIVLDVMLPDINGKEVCNLVRSDATMDDVRIICISGMVEQEKIQELRDAGADEFMKKPFDVDQLVTRVCQLLDVESIGVK